MAADLVSVAIGGSIAIFGGLFTNLSIEHYKNKKAAKHLAQSFLGEIKALKNITEVRGYVDKLKQSIDYIKKTGLPFVFEVKVRKNNLIVYTENAGKIGILEEPLPEYLATFYTITNSILEDLESLSDGTYSGRPPEVLVNCYSQMVDLFTQAQELGEKITDIISKRY